MQRTAGRKIKAQRAQAAFVGTFVRMNADMILETFSGPKRFVTVRTTVTSTLLMRSRMIVQRVFQAKLATADVTTKRKDVNV